MKRLLLTIQLLLAFQLFAIAQKAGNSVQHIPAHIVQDYISIIDLIKSNNASQLSKLVSYPLKRPNPLPDIANAPQFVNYFRTLFDADFKVRLQQFKGSVIFEHEGQFGLVGGPFNGDLWIDEDGRITGVNYSSKAEERLKMELTKKIKSSVYPAVNQWTSNVLVGRSDKLLIRIDETDKGLMYTAWRKGKPTTQQPDLVICGGNAEALGTMGGWTYTFKNGDWTYIVDRVQMCETPAGCGLFMRLLLKGNLNSRIRLKEVKQ